jgi:N-hydroxyarylamine O-acetyltransferase
VSAYGEWRSDLLDLRAYLDRVGVSGELAADECTLARLHRAHVLSIPFENADIVLGRPVHLDLDTVQAKLVAQRRGGYCYEHAVLFGAVLDRIGFPVRRISGRIRMGTDEVRARTHVGLLVGEPENGWLADVGLGSAGPIGPMRWRDGYSSDEGRWSYRLDRARRDEAGQGREWIMRIARPEGWFDLYSIDDTPQHVVDYEVGNHYVSTHPDSPFVRRLAAGSTRPDCRVRLADRTCTLESAPGESQKQELDDEELRHVLVDDMGIALTGDDLVALTAMTRPDLVDR